jgi:Tfp pilus assembly protein PilF
MKSFGIFIGGVVTLLGLLKGIVEVNNLFKTTEQRRITLRYLNTLTLQAIESADYPLAQKYVERAATIDPSSYQVASSRAVIDSLTAYQDQLKSNLTPSRYLVYKLQSLGLSASESEFCMAMAERQAAIESTERLLTDVASNAADTRLRALAQYEYAVSVIAPRLKNQLKRDELDAMLKKLQDAQKEIDKAPTSVASMIPFLTTATDPLDRELAKAMKEEIQDYIKKITGLQTACAASPEKRVEALEKLAQNEPVNSPVQVAAQSQSNKISLDADEQKATTGKDDALREAINLKRAGKYEDAAKKLADVIAASPKDTASQYRAHFSLALIYEYQKHNAEGAEKEYLEAEKYHDAAAKGNPSLPNTIGYFYYKRALDARTQSERTIALTNAKRYLEKARELGSAKSGNTLDTVNDMIASDASKARPAPAG